jgi:hypothetical protein
MSDNLSDLLVDLASNPDRMAAFQAHPERVFDEAGLSNQERAVMQSPDQRLLTSTVGAAMRLQMGHSATKGTKKKGAKKKGGKKKAGKKR